MRHAGGHPACQVRRAGAGVHGAVPPRVGGDRSPGDRLRRHRAGGAGHGDGRVDDPARAARSAGAPRPCRRRAAGAPAADASGRPTPTRPCCGTWTRWWSPRRPAILSRRCAGRAGACGRWPWRWTGWAITSVTRWSRSCCTRSATACKATSRPARAASIPIGTRSFATSPQVVRRWQRRRQPTISVDTKKKELVGDFKNGGREWRPAKTPQRVRVHDFVIPATATQGGKAIPYGVYDLQRDEGWVSVGIDHDTASFAVQAIRRWWRVMGRPVYRHAQSLLITADAGGSNGARLRLWKWELQRLANRTGPHHHGVPLPAGHEQVEQDRASPVLPHRHELARDTAREPRHDREPDWRDAQPIGAARPIRAGSRPLSERRRRDGRPDGHGAPRTASLPR